MAESGAMKPDQVLKHRPVVLSEAQRAQYFEQGYLVLPDHVPAAWIERLRAAMAETIELSRSVTRSDGTFILEEGHSAKTPRLHRVTSPHDRHPVFWQFMADPVMTDLAADVVGPDVKFHSAKLNVKSGEGSRGFKWHQDIQGWPHTDYSPVTIGVYIDGCEAGQGPIACVRGSHQGPLYSMYDDRGNFVVHVRDEELGFLKDAVIEEATGGPGTALLAELPHRARLGDQPLAQASSDAADGLFLGRFVRLYLAVDLQPAYGRYRAWQAGALRQLRYPALRGAARLARDIPGALDLSEGRGTAGRGSGLTHERKQ